MHWRPVHPARPLLLGVRWTPAHLRGKAVRQYQRARVWEKPKGLVLHWIPVHPVRLRLLGVHWIPEHLRAVAVPRSLKPSQKQERMSTPWAPSPIDQETMRVKEPEGDKLSEGLQ